VTGVRLDKVLVQEVVDVVAR